MPAHRIVLDHLTVTVADLDVSAAFWDAALAPLGVVRVVDYLDPEDEDEVGVEAVGYAGADERVVLWLVAGPHPTTGLHVAVTAADADAVRAFHAAAVAAGGMERRPPRGWEIYRPGEFGAMVAAPDGTLVEAVAAG